jgi:hypothetical protein
MKCSKCKLDTDVSDTRTLTTEDNVCFIRRIRYCSKRHKTITHEILVKKSPIPDVYRLKRIRLPSKPRKKQEVKNEQWLKKIMSKLDS